MATLLACCALDAGTILTILLFYANSMILSSNYGGWLEQILPAPDLPCNSTCIRFFIIYKLGWALAIYHLIQAALLVGVEDSHDGRAVIQQGFWPLKVVLLLGMGFGSLYIPNWLMQWLQIPTLILGIVFLLIQAVLLVDLAYTWAESLLENSESGQRRYMIVLVGSTFVMTAATLAVIVLVYLYFGRDLERTLATINGILLVIMFICSILPSVQDANPSSGIFQASFIGLYSLLVLISAFINDPARPRGPNALLIDYPILSKLVACFSVVFAFLVVAHSALGTGNNLHRMAPTSESSDKGALDTDDEAAGRYNYSLFHVGFALAAIYTTLYVTFWQNAIVESGKLVIIDNLVAFWSRVASSWVVCGLYLWSLFAPLVFADRF